MITSHPPVPISEYLEPLYPNDGHSSLATIEFASSSHWFFNESIHFEIPHIPKEITIRHFNWLHRVT
jgi:hypothetical protein